MAEQTPDFSKDKSELAPTNTPLILLLQFSEKSQYLVPQSLTSISPEFRLQELLSLTKSAATGDPHGNNVPDASRILLALPLLQPFAAIATGRPRSSRGHPRVFLHAPRPVRPFPESGDHQDECHDNVRTTSSSSSPSPAALSGSMNHHHPIFVSRRILDRTQHLGFTK
ncbi:uncharacterized protein [Triticum aestivum]|uniref:uncharacterized protein n=1 Tax=Triticum aestivum TaxID=4565 RepID=UPI001D034440|nr:uncharacterized protein LOC123101823 [Triticum aestivum]